jgi:hypothetical protein
MDSVHVVNLKNKHRTAVVRTFLTHSFWILPIGLKDYYGYRKTVREKLKAAFYNLDYITCTQRSLKSQQLALREHLETEHS